MRDRTRGWISSLILGLATLLAFVGIGLAANSQSEAPGSPLIDYQGFEALTDEVFEIRNQRLIDIASFNAMKADPDTIILDTRSAAAFDMGHIEGAINLPFSDFTDEKLAKVIPSMDTRILIYCNNNFMDNIEPVPVKRVELALNIPTFINLYGYGYENIYELGDLLQTGDADVNWVSAFDLQEN